jgi:DNA-binding beta-propeller fold protein YncE
VVQHLLNGMRWQNASAAMLLAGAALLPASMQAAGRGAGKVETKGAASEWVMSLDGGRSLTWERNFRSEQEVHADRRFWNKLVNFIAGAPDYHVMVQPYSVVTDSHGRIIVTDPGAGGVHVFDFAERKYKFLERTGKSDSMLNPQCVAVDDQDNIYVTDSEAGEIFVFEPGGKHLRTIGALKGGEGYFKRPTGIAVDSAAQRIYVSDTLRDKVYVLDMQGNILQTIGREGDADGEFRYPTELRLTASSLLVVDSMNFRVQAFDRTGTYQYSIGKIGDGPGAIFRPKAVGMDSEGDLYVVDSLWGVVQVFNQQSQLLYYFGARGTQAGEFQLPTGLYIDHNDHVFVVDSFNRRVQEFQYAGVKPEPGDAK